MIYLIVAMDKNGAIGYNNRLLCSLKDDLKIFKEVTWKQTVVMGRKTYESIGKPLPSRDNIVITSKPSRFDSKVTEDGYTLLFTNNVSFINSLADIGDVFIIGGESLYRHFIDFADRIYLTEIDNRFEKADTYFPVIKPYQWKESYVENHFKNERNDFDFSFKVLERA